MQERISSHSARQIITVVKNAAPARRGLLLTPEINVMLFSVLLNLPWEFIQAPLFEHMADAVHWQATLLCLRAALGDGLMSVAAYLAAAILVRDRYWAIDRKLPGRALAAFIALPIVATIVIERLALAGIWMEGWSYSALMPVVPVIGVGLSPLVQWIVLPLAVFWLVRRQIRRVT